MVFKARNIPFIMAASDVHRSKCLVPCGWILAFAMYIVQAAIFLKFMEEHTSTANELYWIGIAIFLAFAGVVSFFAWKYDGYADSDRGVWIVWGLWFIYILLYTISVVIIFSMIAGKLEKTDTFGPNFLKSTLSIAPALLVLVLQLVISPIYRRAVLLLSVIAALNLFDGIEMLEIVLMQNEREDFNLDERIERCILAFACLSFLVTSLGLSRNKFKDGNGNGNGNGNGKGTVEERDNKLSVCLGFSEILLINVPFLALRIYVWADCGYEASIFIAKNVVSVVVGFIEFCIACKLCTCK